MKREKLKKILEEVYESQSTINHVLRGTRTPDYKKMLYMYRSHKVPFTIWEDIKSYLQENDTSKGTNNAI